MTMPATTEMRRRTGMAKPRETTEVTAVVPKSIMSYNESQEGHARV